MQKVETGKIYEHYKGQHYKVYDVVRHSETLEEMVLYECLYENELGKMWVRPIDNFTSSLVVNGVNKKRFKLMEPQPCQNDL